MGFTAGRSLGSSAGSARSTRSRPASPVTRPSWTLPLGCPSTLQLTNDAAALQLASLSLDQCRNGFQSFLIELEGLLTEELTLILFLRTSRRTVSWSEDEVVFVEVTYQNEVEVLVRLAQE